MKRIIGIPRAPHTSPEGDGCELLQGHHVEGGGDGLLSSTLCALAELLQGLSLSEPHLDLDSVTSKLCLLVSLTEADLTVVTLKDMLMILLMRVRP